MDTATTILITKTALVLTGFFGVLIGSVAVVYGILVRPIFEGWDEYVFKIVLVLAGASCWVIGAYLVCSCF